MTKKRYKRVVALCDLVIEESFSPLVRLLNGDVIRMNHLMSSGSPWHSLGTTVWWAYVLIQALDPEKSSVFVVFALMCIVVDCHGNAD